MNHHWNYHPLCSCINCGKALREYVNEGRNPKGCGA